MTAVGVAARTKCGLAATAVVWIVLMTLSFAMPSVASAQAVTNAADPIRCWWRTSAGAVAIGEPFDATLTCAVREDGSMRVVPDESRLDAAAIQLSPFEILGGSHPADLRTETHRFIQYRYSVRIIDRDVIGHDAKFPDVRVNYRIESRGGSEALEGRERTYVLPGYPVRVLSLVPAEADDIRDSADESFARVEALQFRSRALQIGSIAMIALAIIVLAPAVIGLVRPRSAQRESGQYQSSRHGILAASLAELEDVQRASRSGWTTDLAARAAAAVRIAAAVALGRPISQQPGNATVPPEAGRLDVSIGRLRKTTLTISSSLTAAELRKALDRSPVAGAAGDRGVLDDLNRALGALTSALYEATFNSQDSALDDSLSSAIAATLRWKRAHSWPRRLFTRTPAAHAEGGA